MLMTCSKSSTTGVERAIVSALAIRQRSEAPMKIANHLHQTLTVAALALTTTMCGSVASARQCKITEIDKLIPSDPVSFDEFGGSAAIDGSVVVIGAKGPATPQLPGAAYVFSEVATGQWEQTQKLVANDGVNYDWFGKAVAISGDTIAVGAPLHDAAGFNAGAVYIFTFDGKTWVQTQKINSPAGVESANFGMTVAMSGSVLLIATPGVNPDVAYVYRRKGSQWNPEAELHPSVVISPGYQFGLSLSANDDAVIIGAPGFASDAPGKAFVYRFTGSTWLEEAILPNPSQLSKGAGRAVCIKDNMIAIGAPGPNWPDCPGGCGVSELCHVTYVYQFDGKQWIERGGIRPNYYTFGHSLSGRSLAIIGDAVLDGETQVFTYGLYAGAAYLYRPDDAGTPEDTADDCWAVPMEFVPADIKDQHGFGYTIAASGNRAVIVAFGDDPTVPESGSAYIYEFEDCGTTSNQCEPAPPEPPKYILTDLGTLGGNQSRALDVNNSTQVVGYSDPATPPPPPFQNYDSVHAFIWENGTMTELSGLQTPEPFWVRANAINDLGQIVGDTSQYYGWTSIPTMWVNGVPMFAGPLGPLCEAIDINNNSTVIGTCRSDVWGDAKIFYWNPGAGPQTLFQPADDEQVTGRALNDLGEVIGDSYSLSMGPYAFLWDNGDMTSFAEGAGNAIAMGINEKGEIVGSYGGNCGAYLRRNGTLLTLGTIGGNDSDAHDINESSWIVGSAQVAGGAWHAFLFIEPSMHDLNDLLVAPSSFVMHTATALNDSGEIVGYGTAPGGQTHAFLLRIPQLGDVDLDADVDVDDLLAIINNWGPCPAPCPADVTGNGEVDVDDLLAVINHWG
jgi:probable HAF family extracellular repeat protein